MKFETLGQAIRNLYLEITVDIERYGAGISIVPPKLQVEANVDIILPTILNLLLRRAVYPYVSVLYPRTLKMSL